MLYGGIGVEISSAILSSVYPPGVAYATNGILLEADTVAVNRSIAATVEARLCFGQFIKDQQVVNNTALTAISSVSSVRFALQVSGQPCQVHDRQGSRRARVDFSFCRLQSLLKKTNTELHYHQPAMESYDYDSLFFITYAQVSTNVVRSFGGPRLLV